MVIIYLLARYPSMESWIAIVALFAIAIIVVLGHHATPLQRKQKDKVGDSLLILHPPLKSTAENHVFSAIEKRSMLKFLLIITSTGPDLLPSQQ
jgi:hypothetical protein